MKTKTLDKLIWTLIYGGLLSVGLGLSIEPNDNPIGWFFVSGGAVVSVAGAVLVYVRSRMKDTP
jgi:hypothetical protein